MLVHRIGGSALALLGVFILGAATAFLWPPGAGDPIVDRIGLAWLTCIILFGIWSLIAGFCFAAIPDRTVHHARRAMNAVRDLASKTSAQDR